MSCVRLCSIPPGIATQRIGQLETVVSKPPQHFSRAVSLKQLHSEGEGGRERVREGGREGEGGRGRERGREGEGGVTALLCSSAGHVLR